MRKTIIVGAVALGAVITAVVYLTDDSADDSANQSSATIQSESGKGVGAESVTPEADAQLSSVAQARAPSKPVPADPRLVALMVSPDNGLIEFVVGSDGTVIKEIDKDPNSPGFKKPLREYMYSDGKVIGLTSYRYLGDHVQVTKTAVSYKPDGSVDQYLESTRYDYDRSKGAG